MLYVSLALIFLGISIFIYSLIVDAKQRRDALRPDTASDRGSTMGAGNQHPGGAGKKIDKDPRTSGGYSGRKNGRARDTDLETDEAGRNLKADRGARKGAPQPDYASGDEIPAVLFEDSSHVVDYGNESGSIDPSLEGYKNIKRIGSGQVALEKGGITFHMGKKLYRYDFNRVRDIKSGKSHLALFLEGSESVKLFIIESGIGFISAVYETYRDQTRSSD